MTWTHQMQNSHYLAVDVMLAFYPVDEYTAPGNRWDLNTFSEEAPTTHKFITSDGIVTTIIMPAMEIDYAEEKPRGYMTFWAQITAANGAVLVNAAFRVRDPMDGEDDPAIVSTRLLFADALAAARAGALPGLEALYLAQAAQTREAAEYNERERRARIELAVKERQMLGEILAHFGITGITAESCAIGRWESEESATWCHAGAAISFGPGSGRIYVAVDEGDIENRWQDWMHLPDGEIEPCHKAAPLSMIQRAAERAETVAQAKQATPQPLQPLTLRPFHLVEWFSGHDEQIQTWANEQRVNGYDDLKLIPSRDGVFATMHLVPDEE